MKIVRNCLIMLIISMGYAHAQGVINVQNGNINHFYEDFVVPGHGFPLELERSYNSKSKYNGIFGPKWGSNFDLEFNITPEGTVEITEYGGGFKTTFAPQGFTPKNIEAFIATLWEKIPAASQSEQLKKDLKEDAPLRHKLAREHKISSPIPMNAMLYANDRGPETLKKNKLAGQEGFEWTRSFADGTKEYFNDKGQLVRREDGNKNYLKLSYSATGQLSKVVDATGRQILFTYTSAGKVQEVTNPLGEKSLFKYDPKTGDLVYAKNTRGFEFTYQYDGRNRMTEVTYVKAQKKEVMKYDDENRIIYHEGPEDIKTTYKYDTKGSPNKYFDVVVSKEIGKKPNQVVTVDKYAYEFGVRDNGTRYTYKLATVLDGVTTETVYTPCCGKPISISRQGQVTRFEYSGEGLLKKKIAPSGEMIALDYDKDYQKVSKVVRSNPKLKSSDTTEYKYDKNGNLAYAKNESKKIHVQLVYDTKGRIKRLVDQSGKKIFFNYNELGKPTKITLEGVGSIVVSYNAAGNITNVKSTGGRKIATEVTSTFQTLLDVIRPAGVSLNM